MATFPGGSNTYVQSWAASGRLQVEFSRNPKSFALNQYVALRQVEKERGYYLRITPEEAARAVSMNDHVWPDGGSGASTHDMQEEFTFDDYVCTRYKFNYTIGYLASEQGDFDILAVNGRTATQKAMTFRAYAALTALTTAANWSGNTATATALGGGTWAASSATNNYILRTFLEVQLRVNKATLGVVQGGALRCIISPALAAVIRYNQEVIDFIKQQASSPMILEGQQFFYKWGLPEYLYGVRLIIDDTVRISTRKNKVTAGTGDYVLGNSIAVFASLTQDVKGDQVRKPEKGAGVPIFDTLTLFVKEDMTVESKDDADNRRTEARVVDHYGIELTAPASGYLVTGCQ